MLVEIARESVREWHAPHVEKFLPAIVDTQETRNPDWYALRCVAGQEPRLLWFLDRIRMPVRHLFFFQKVKRRKQIRRSYLPGYLFLNFDAELDRWQQIRRMPHVLEYLGGPSPIPTPVFEDLCRRCPERIGRTTVVASVALGTTIRVKNGPLAGHKAAVIWSDRKQVKVPVLLFGSREVEMTLRVEDIEVVAE